MAIVKQTLHPEGDTGTDIYPKTSTDQIDGLPQSAKSQLYGHYIRIYSNRSAAENMPWVSMTMFFINSQSNVIDTLAEIINAIKGRFVCSGIIQVTDPKGAMVAENVYSAYMMITNGSISGGDLVFDVARTDERVNPPTNAAYATWSMTEILGENWDANGYTTITDNVVAIGSNAG